MEQGTVRGGGQIQCSARSKAPRKEEVESLSKISKIVDLGLKEYTDVLDVQIDSNVRINISVSVITLNQPVLQTTPPIIYLRLKCFK